MIDKISTGNPLGARRVRLLLLQSNKRTAQIIRHLKKSNYTYAREGHEGHKNKHASLT